MLAWTGVAVAALSILVQALTAGLGALACQAAAQHALQVTRVAGGTTMGGLNDASDVLQQTAGRTVRDSRIVVTRTPQTSTVTITATAIPVLPALSIPLRATTSGPTEPDLVQQP